MKNEQEIETLLNSLDGVGKASPGDFFYTRVQARLQKEDAGFWGGLAGFLTKPAVAFSTLSLIFLLNTAVFFYEKRTSVTTPDQNEQASTEDYNTTLAANSYYDENSEAH